MRKGGGGQETRPAQKRKGKHRGYRHQDAWARRKTGAIVFQKLGVQALRANARPDSQLKRQKDFHQSHDGNPNCMAKRRHTV